MADHKEIYQCFEFKFQFESSRVLPLRDHPGLATKQIQAQRTDHRRRIVIRVDSGGQPINVINATFLPGLCMKKESD